MSKFTAEQMKWYDAYVEVQMSGVTNMFDGVRVCTLSGLTKEQYIFVMKNYNDLYEQANNSKCKKV